MKLNHEEIQLLELKHLGLENQEIIEHTKIGHCEFKRIKKSLFSKLKVYNWFNCLKKAFEYNLLNKSNFITNNIDNYLHKGSHKVYCILKVSKLSEKEKLAAVYKELLSFYNELEYRFCFKEYSII